MDALKNAFSTPTIPAALAVGGTALDVQSRLAQGDAALLVGQRRKTASDFEAKQLEQNAGQQQAAGQAAAIEQKRQSDLVMSRALAVAAASGAGASSPTVTNLLARSAGEGEYRSMLAMYQGDEAARKSRAQATAQRYEGDIALSDARRAKDFSEFGAMTTALKGVANVTSMFSKYWAGPKNDVPSGTRVAANDWVSGFDLA